ncbi:MAG: GNAT family N-acetyltransferase [Kofleriaceae bacterium]|nr:GNAT family N-acetyltransferase [Kofleriaceae bacterium]
MGAAPVTAQIDVVPRKRGSGVTLRRAMLGECERVYAYNAAADVRALSGKPTPILLGDHEMWFARRIADVSSPFWIIEDDGVPVGSVRIDARADMNARISIALDSSARGRGIGRRAIVLACADWRGIVVAEIHEGNAQSRACFTACGFVQMGKHDAFDVYQWSP